MAYTCVQRALDKCYGHTSARLASMHHRGCASRIAVAAVIAGSGLWAHLSPATAGTGPAGLTNPTSRAAISPKVVRVKSGPAPTTAGSGGRATETQPAPGAEKSTDKPVVAELPIVRNPATVPQDRASRQNAANAAAEASSRRLGGDGGAGRVGSLLTHVDKVHIKFPNQASLNGEFSISGDETISIPIIGRYDVRGLTLSGLESLLASEFQRVFGVTILPSVDVVKYRDVMVTGQVNHPGAFPWRREMTVLQAETLAGGLFRPTSATTGALAYDVEFTRARRAAADVARLSIRLARLKAERANMKDFDVPANVGKIISEDELQAIIAAQRTLLASRRTVHEARKQKLERSLNVGTVFHERSLVQQHTLAQLVNDRRRRVSSLMDLGRKGIITQERVFNEQTRLMELEERASTIEYNYRRNEIDRDSMAREFEVAEVQRLTEIDAETQLVERELAQLQIELTGAASSIEAISGRNALKPGVTRVQMGMRQTSYRIIRIVDGQSTTINGSSDAILVPGDVLMVAFTAEPI